MSPHGSNEDVIVVAMTMVLETMVLLHHGPRTVAAITDTVLTALATLLQEQLLGTSSLHHLHPLVDKPPMGIPGILASRHLLRIWELLVSVSHHHLLHRAWLRCTMALAAHHLHHRARDHLLQ